MHIFLLPVELKFFARFREDKVVSVFNLAWWYVYSMPGLSPSSVWMQSKADVLNQAIGGTFSFT
jgi:hypothetical protein